MAVDNPSYFSLQGGANTSNSNNNGSTTTPAAAPPPRSSFGSFFRRNKSSSKTDRLPVPQQPVNSVVSSQRNPMSGSISQRRSLRNLFRSASANGDCEKTRQFLKGEPLPSDIAPPSPYLNSRSHMLSKSSGRRQAPKSTNELLSMDMVFCGLPGENGAPGARRSEDNDYYHYDQDSECSEAATLPIDEVEDEARSYYNITATLPKGSSMYSSMGRRKSRQSQQQRRARRHSIGTFLDRDRSALNATSSRKQSVRSTDLVVEPELNDEVDCAGRTGGRLGTRHAQPGTFGSRGLQQMESQQQQQPRDDVVFVSSKDSETSALWVNYLTACFEQISRQQGRPPFRVSQVAFEEPQSPSTDLKIRNSRLQIIVVCPMFLERVSERPEQAANMTRQLGSERVLAMMLGVQDAHLSTSQRANLIAYDTWRKFFVKDQDETFVGQFLGAAVAILGSSNNSTTNGSLKLADKIGFSVHPKKVKMGQNRILALLNEPLHQDDSVTVMVDRCGEALEITNVKRRNPYTLQFAIPDRCLDVSMLVGVRVARNGVPLGNRQVKCESRLRELDQILRAHDNPLEFMCQTFGFNPGDKEQLDNWMVHAFQKNIPPHFNLLSNPPGDLQISKNHSSSEENPTLLHFAARFGLEKLAWQLLECPGADIACDMKNTNDLTPADLAEQAGHVRLAHQLRGYMQMNEFSNMYSYLKVMSENTNGSANGYRALAHPSPFHPCPEEDAIRQEDYCRPRPISEAYSVPPIARPVLSPSTTPCSFPDYSTPPPLPQPNPVASHTTDDESGSNVSTPMMPIYASTSTLNASSLDLPLQALRSTPDSMGSTPTLTSSQLTLQSPSTEPTDPKNTDNSDRQSSKSGSSKQSSRTSEEPQDELLEIITDFKNNVFTISEVERLVENWRNRNDVQQSFKDKQRQLSAMRDEYERIQKRMKEEMKNSSTPFDRIRKFFTKGKKAADSKESAGTSSESSSTSKQNGNLADRRPVSSLSLHSVSSSSSSGRISTISGCSGTSLGDSGTHSDTEDRRLQPTIAEDKTNVSGMTCYEIPPAPKPYHAPPRIYNGLHNHHHHPHHHCPHHGRYTPVVRAPGGSANSSELDLRAVKSSYPTTDDKEYYISFPPSGLPVHSFKADGSVREPSTPGTPADDSKSTGGMSGNYANVSPTALNPPAGMFHFQYMNLGAAPPRKENILTVQPEIHPEPVKPNIMAEEQNDDDDSDDDLPLPPPPPPLESSKILNTDCGVIPEEQSCDLPDYSNVQVAASEEIARNFGVTLKKLPPPPVPPRSEFTFATCTAENAAKIANE